MKVIFVMADSLRLDHLGYMGNKWIHTPNLDAFSTRANVFTHSIAGSWATVLNRMDLLLGRYGHPERKNWRFAPDDIPIGRVLEGHGIPSQLVSNVANTISSRNLYEGFTAYTHLRGQEGDPYFLDDSVPYKQTCPLSMIRYPKERWHQVLMNRAHREVETDWFAPEIFNWAMQWLERNYKRDNFLLWIDGFDPHEPFDPPQHYIDLYDPGYEGRIMEAPTYGVRKQLDFTDRELEHTRARYAGEITMVDHWFGKLLEMLKRLQIEDDTMVVFTTDHGHYFDYPNDGGLTGKATCVSPDGRWSYGEDAIYHPLYLSMLRQPLLIRVPGTKSRRIPAFVQPCDITPTILDFFGKDTPHHCQGESLLPLMAGKKRRIRDAAHSAFPGFMSLVTNKRWSYCCWLGTRPCALWDLQKDPNQKHNVARKHPSVVRKLHSQMIKALREQGADEEYIARHDPMM